MNKKKPLLKENISLRNTFVIILVVSIILTSALIASAIQVFFAYQSLSDATDQYVELKDAAEQLLKASDYLTDEVQRFSVTADKTYMIEYLNEAEVKKNREEAIETMESKVPNSEALKGLNTAMNGSIQLMEKEYHAMRLVLSATNDTDVPEAVKSITLTPYEESLTRVQKMERARDIVHNEDYYAEKEAIYANLNHCIHILESEMRKAQNETNKKASTSLIWMFVLIALQSLSLFFIFGLVMSLVVNPIFDAVKRIKEEKELSKANSSEFQCLVDEYNKMYNYHKQNEKDLSYKAFHDELTGLYNRAGYDALLTDVKSESIAFLLIDTDNFKEINDTYGHDVGDRILKKIANELETHFRIDDHIFRIGGDEFVVIINNATKDMESVIQYKIWQINESLSSPKDNLPSVSLSVGITLSVKNADIETLYTKADEALYRVKDMGRHGCTFYKPEESI